MNGYAIFVDNDGSETKLSWEELKLEETGKKYGYNANDIQDKKLGNCAFCRTEIKEIAVPEGVEDIKWCGFENCKQLEKVILPSTLKRIENLAFAETAIKEIEIPESVELVKELAFRDCKQLEKIIAPKGLYINFELENIIERHGEINGYQEMVKKFKELVKNPTEKELNNISTITVQVKKIDQEQLKEVLKLRDSNGERYFDFFEIGEFYNHYRAEEYYDYIDQTKANEDLKQIVRFSEGLGIKPNFKNDVNKLREQYIKKVEDRNEYLEKMLREYLPQKEKENDRDNMPVHANENERD